MSNKFWKISSENYEKVKKWPKWKRSIKITAANASTGNFIDPVELLENRLDWPVEYHEQIDRAIALSGMDLTGVIKRILPCAKCSNKTGLCPSVFCGPCVTCDDTQKNWERG
jgi:hypothetical protein